MKRLIASFTVFLAVLLASICVASAASCIGGGCTLGGDCVISSSCELDNTICSGVCNFNNLTIDSSAVLSSTFVGLTSNRIDLNITDNLNISTGSSIDTSGQNGGLSTSGGAGGIINITAGNIVGNGTFDSSGGNGGGGPTGGDGGSAAEMIIYSNYIQLYNLFAIGGNGATGNAHPGGNGGNINIISNNIFGNNIENSGGSPAGGGGPGNGGNILIISNISMKDFITIPKDGVAPNHVSSGGIVNISGYDIYLDNITTSTKGTYANTRNAGSVTINSGNTFSIRNIYAEGDNISNTGVPGGNGGNVIIKAKDLFNLTGIYAIAGKSNDNIWGTNGTVTINVTNFHSWESLSGISGAFSLKLSNFENAPSKSKIQFTQDINFTNSISLKDYVSMGQGFVSLNSSGIIETGNDLNKSAVVTLFVGGCQQLILYHTPNHHTSLIDLLADPEKVECVTAGLCTNVVCDSGTGLVTFSVPHFDGYGSGGGVPEFGTITLMLALVIVVAGFFRIRNRKQ